MTGDISFAEVVAFHGDACPELALGYRMTQSAMSRLAELRTADERLVAVVENGGCGVDAVQCVSGCTLGKGTLICKGGSNQVYTFFSEASGRAVRVSPAAGAGRHSENGRSRGDRRPWIEWLLTAPEREVVEVEELDAVPPVSRLMRIARAVGQWAGSKGPTQDCPNDGKREGRDHVIAAQ